MIVTPSLDLMGGKCVRLVRGRPEDSIVFYPDPSDALRWLIDENAKLVHLVDLDAALGTGDNLEVIKRLLKTPELSFHVGGGIRTIDRAECLVQRGAERVIFGTATINSPALITEAVERFSSSRVGVAIDVRGGKVAIRGWQTVTNTNPLLLARSMEESRVGSILYTCVDADGTLKGPSLEEAATIVRSVKTPVFAAGGIRDLNDLMGLKRVGVAGAIIGRALYERRFTLREAVETVAG